MPIPVDDAIDILRGHISDSATLQAIAKDLLAAEKEAKADRGSDAAPKTKNTMVVLIRGDAALKSKLEGGAWVVSVPDPVDGQRNPTPLLDRVSRAVKGYNEGLKRGKTNKSIRTFARAMEKLSPKSIKNSGGDFKVKTKLPVEVIVVESDTV